MQAAGFCANGWAVCFIQAVASSKEWCTPVESRKCTWNTAPTAYIRELGANPHSWRCLRHSRFPAVTHGTITLTSGSCMGEKWVVLARDLLQGTWWESLCLTEVVPGLSLVRGGAGSNNTHSSSKGWFQYLLGFPSGKKGWCRGSGPQQWVPALSSSLERAVTG